MVILVDTDVEAVVGADLMGWDEERKPLARLGVAPPPRSPRREAPAKSERKRVLTYLFCAPFDNLIWAAKK